MNVVEFKPADPCRAKRTSEATRLQSRLAEKLEQERDRINAEIDRKLEAAENVDSAAYEVSTAIYNLRVEIDLDINQEH